MALSLDRSTRYALLIIITMKVFEYEYSECRTRWKFTHCNSYCTMSLYINACTCLQSKFTFCPHSHSIYSCEVAGQVYSHTENQEDEAGISSGSCAFCYLVNIQSAQC